MFCRFLQCSLFLQLLIVQKIAVTLGKSDVDPEHHRQNNIDKHLQEQSNIISEQEKIVNLFDHLEYYFIPQQTVYSGVDGLLTSNFISTSPPRLTIQPSSVSQSSILSTVLSTVSYSSKPQEVVEMPPPLVIREACFSETYLSDIRPSSPLKSSISTTNEVSVMAGREQMPSKTEPLSEFYHPASIISQPSRRLVLRTYVPKWVHR